MRVKTATFLLLGLIKVALATVGMTYLYMLLLITIGVSIMSRYQPLREGRGVAWIVMPAVYVVAIFIVSILSGVLCVRDRWIVRPAAVVSVLWFFFFATLGLFHLSRVAPSTVVSSHVKMSMIPLGFVVVIAFLFSPFFHDLGHILRRRMGGPTTEKAD